MAKQITAVTQAGFQKLKEELEFLKNVKRREAAEAVGVARSYGDLSENSEYDEAKNEQAKVEAQIAELEETLAHIKIVNNDDINTNIANIGLTVKVLYIDDLASVKGETYWLRIADNQKGFCDRLTLHVMIVCAVLFYLFYSFY